MMKVAGVACLVALSAGVVLTGAGGFPTGVEPEFQVAQGQVDAAARRSADEVAASARTWLGNLHPAGQLEFRRWILAVRSWKDERAARPAALLAEGVLFDCLGRTLGLNTGFTSGLAVDPRFNELGQPYRLRRAAELFEDALEADPDLIEARFRAVRIRALDNAKAAVELERIASAGTDAGIAYLAAVSRAAIAQARNDSPTAIRWYEHALELHGRSTAATAGLSVLDPNRPVPFESLDPDDPYYTYPCRILTPAVATELARRMDGLSSR